MKARTYKNGNITVRCEGERAPRKLFDFAQFLCERLPEDMEAFVETGDEYSMEVICKANGKKRYYSVTEDTMTVFNEGKTVRLKSWGLAPCFKLPKIWDDEWLTYDGQKGTLFTFCEKVPEDTRKRMEEAGCTMFVSSPAYAPEIRREAVFVPRGVAFSYC